MICAHIPHVDTDFGETEVKYKSFYPHDPSAIKETQCIELRNTFVSN